MRKRVFDNLIKLASQPVKSWGKTRKRGGSVGYSGKRTRPRKIAGISGKQRRKSRQSPASDG